MWCFCVARRWLRLFAVEDGKYRLKMCDGKVLYELDVKTCQGCQCPLERVDENGKREEVQRACVRGDGGIVECMDTYGVEGVW